MKMFVKRLIDLTFSVLFIAIFSPVYILTALIIVISSPGNPIYKACRVGYGGEEFICYKFRSMCVNSGKVHLITLENDERVFPFGRFIRKTKIDEMPQVFNILIGNMSVVGPRPEEVDNLMCIPRDKYMQLISVKPGLTSPASLLDYTHGEVYTTEESYEKEFLPIKLSIEVYYVRHWTLWYDLKIIVKTAFFIVVKTCGKREFELPKEFYWVKHTDEKPIGQKV